MYAVEYSKSSQKALRRLPRNLMNRIFNKMENIARNPYSHHNNVKSLKGSPYYRLRVGDWRVIYEIQDDQILIIVLKIASRGEIYK